MSKIYTKNTRNPFIVERKIAEKMHDDFITKRKSPDEMITLVHSTGKTSFLFGDIKGIDVTNNDNDFNASWKDSNDKVYTPVQEFEMPTEEDKRTFAEKSKLLKQMMGWK